MIVIYIMWGILIITSIIIGIYLIYDRIQELKLKLNISNRELKRLNEKIKWDKK